MKLAPRTTHPSDNTCAEQPHSFVEVGEVVCGEFWRMAAVVVAQQKGAQWDRSRGLAQALEVIPSLAELADEESRRLGWTGTRLVQTM